MKYIVTERANTDEEEIFIFPRSIDHDAMAESLRGIKDKTWGNWVRIFRTPISAGFIDSDNKCFGMSETMNLESRLETDTALISPTHR